MNTPVYVASSWTSLFNVSWIFVKPAWHGLTYGIAFMIGCFIAITIFTLTHEKRLIRATKENRLAYAFHYALYFVFIGVLLSVDYFL